MVAIECVTTKSNFCHFARGKDEEVERDCDEESHTHTLSLSLTHIRISGQGKMPSQDDAGHKLMELQHFLRLQPLRVTAIVLPIVVVVVVVDWRYLHNGTSFFISQTLWVGQPVHRGTYETEHTNRWVRLIAS